MASTHPKDAKAMIDWWSHGTPSSAMGRGIDENDLPKSIFAHSHSILGIENIELM
jgi:hypothetical protein